MLKQYAHRGLEHGCLSAGFQHLGYTTELRNHRAFHNTGGQPENLDRPSKNLGAEETQRGSASDGFLESGLEESYLKKWSPILLREFLLARLVDL